MDGSKADAFVGVVVTPTIRHAFTMTQKAHIHSLQACSTRDLRLEEPHPDSRPFLFLGEKRRRRHRNHTSIGKSLLLPCFMWAASCAMFRTLPAHASSMGSTSATSGLIQATWSILSCLSKSLPNIVAGAVGAAFMAMLCKYNNNNSKHSRNNKRTVIRGTSPFYAASQSVGDLVFVSGQVAFVPGTQTLKEGGIGEQTRQTLEHLKSVLEESGSSLDHVLKTTCYLNDVSDYPTFNQVYLEFFPHKTVKPARVCFGPGGLPFGALVEIDATAVRS
eukprot:scaffold37257_cov54-Attheya_sp.AAC.2